MILHGAWDQVSLAFWNLSTRYTWNYNTGSQNSLQRRRNDPLFFTCDCIYVCKNITFLKNCHVNFTNLTAKIIVHCSKTEGGKTLHFVPAGLYFHKRLDSYNEANKLTKPVILHPSMLQTNQQIQLLSTCTATLCCTIQILSLCHKFKFTEVPTNSYL